MRIKVKRLISSTLAFAIVLGLFQPTITNATTNDIELEKQDENNGYEIYPIPHETTYLDDEFVIRKDVNVVYDSTIDEATKNRMEEILESKNKNIEVSDKVVSGKTNILVGTYSANEYVDNYIEDKYEIEESLFEKNHSYYMVADNGEISILGKDTDAAFYGLTTLKHIFNQMDGSTIEELEIIDYADTPIRGFIEGYYGIPWTNEDRMSLMEFGGEFKMTSYIFAPKDDLYHTSKWRELYPKDELAEIAEMVQVGIDTKTKFVWTAHPFMGGFNANNYKGEMEKLIAKFEQLYSVGVRQFGILGDDVGSLNKQIVVDMMTELSEWGKKKGDVYDWVFCPAGYNASWQGDYSELNMYDDQFPENVQIFWTGQSVCAPVSQQTLTNFKTHRAEEGVVRRSPLFWLNWPVNDINMQRLMLGKGSLLHADVNPEDLAGVVTNPMQDAEPSKVSLFAIADYAWNVADFNDNKSWKDSFKYIDENASEALYTIAKHTSDPAPNGHGLVLEESEEINSLLNDFKTKLNNNEEITIVGNTLVNEMDIIIKACSEFIKNSNNERMVEQITPFANSLKDLALAIKSYVQSAIDLENSDNDSAIQNFAEGNTSYESSKSYDRPKLNGFTKAQPGSKRLIPFLESVRDALSDEINALVSGGVDKLVLTATTNISGVWSGNIYNIIDGGNNTFIWNSESEAVGNYYQVNLSKPTTIYGVDILNGSTTDKLDDTFGYAKVQYTTDGTVWKDINSKTYGPYLSEVKITGIEVRNVVGVRYICTATGNGNKWTAMREFKVLTTPEATEAPTFTSEVIRTTDGWSIYGNGNEASILDGNADTGVHYNVRQGGTPTNTTIAGDYVGVKLSEPIILGKINILQGPTASSGDYFKNATLEYSLDGVKYTEIKQCVNERDIVIDLSSQNIEAKYIRLRNNVNQNTWIGFREFEVNAKINHNGKVYTNVEEYTNHPADYFKDNAAMVELQNIKLKNGEYIGLKLDRIHELTEVIVNGTGLENVTLQVSKNAYEWTSLDNKALAENTDARYIRLVNLGNTEVNINVDEFKVASREFEAATVIETNMGTIADGKIENLFDKDRSTGLKYQKTQVNGDYMIIDLGQQIDLNELKIVCHDSDKDYIRDGKVYVSEDKTNWGQEIITIGDQQANTSANDSTINESFPEHEISYNVAKATNINKKARYIKIQITQNYGHRWTKINEIEVNDGAYIPAVNDPTFTSDVIDTENGLYEYLVDRDITTMYVPSADKGYLVYSLSDNLEYNNIKVMQDAKTISNALVSARVTKGNDSSEWIELGTLNKGTNEFTLPRDTKILDVKFEWNGITPNLVDLIFNSILDVTVNKDSLQALVNEELDTTLWTDDSRKAYETVINVAKEILENEYVAQATVNSTIREIEKVKENRELKGDSSIIQATINAAITDGNKYTAKTWNNYQKALNVAKAAMEDIENISEADVIALVNGLNEAKEALVYNPTNREEAELTLEDINMFISSITTPEKTYTESSWSELLNANEALEALIELNKTTPQDPELFETGKNDILNAKNSLVNITSLVALIEEFEVIDDSSIYTEVSYSAYENVVNSARALLVNGTNEAIEAAISKINEAKANLKLAGSSNVLKEFIVELKNLAKENYTNNSYKALMDRVTEVEAMNLDSMNEQQLNVYKNELLELKNSLVDVTALTAQIEIANSFNADLYTTSSYRVLAELVSNAEELFVSGTVESIQKTVTEIDEAIKALELRVNVEELTNYINGIEDIDLSKYTEESVTIYNEALEVLEAMLNNTEDISSKEFISAKDAFEAAKAGLVRNDVDTIKLESFIANTEGLDKNEYIESTWNNFEVVLNEAKAILAKEDVTQGEIDTAYTNLLKAYLSLRLIPNKAKLEELINKVEKMDLSKYTVESVEILNKELRIAKEVLNNETSTQEEIDLASSNVAKAIDNLVENTSNNKDNSNNSTSGNSTNNSNVGKGENKLPQTGGVDTRNILFAGIILLGLGVVFMGTRKTIVRK